MEILHRLQDWQQRNLKSIDLSSQFNTFHDKIRIFFKKVRCIGVNPYLDDYEKRKLGVFNQLNFFQVITGVLIPIGGLLSGSDLPANAWLVASLPAVISIIVLWLNSQQRYELALLSYFIFYPVFTCIIYINGMNLGVELFFVLYGILSVFFFQDIGYMIFSVALSMMSYFILSVVLKNYQYQLKSLNTVVYMVNQLIATGYIFYGLYLIKKREFWLPEKYSGAKDGVE